MGLLVTFDIATNLGWCLAPDVRDIVRYEVGSHQLIKGAPTHVKCAVLSDFLEDFCGNREIVFAAVETPFSAPPRRKKVIKKSPLGFDVETDQATGSIQTQNQLWALHGCTIGQLRRFGIPYRTVLPPQWRAEVLGSGKMSSEDSEAECTRRLEARGIYVPNGNAAEAGGLMNWLQRHFRRFMSEDAELQRQQYG